MVVILRSLGSPVRSETTAVPGGADISGVLQLGDLLLGMLDFLIGLYRM